MLLYVCIHLFFGHNFEGKNEEKKSADDKKHAKLPSMQKVSPCTMIQNALAVTCDFLQCVILTRVDSDSF